MGDWYAIRTATRLEQRAAERLRESGFTVYLPCDTVERKLGGGREAVLRPRYPGYAFLFCREDDISAALAVSHVHAVVRYIDPEGIPRPMPIPAKVVREVFLAQLVGDFDRRSPTYTPGRGDNVKIVGGKWASLGYLATVISITADQRKALLALPNGYRLEEMVAHLAQPEVKRDAA